MNAADAVYAIQNVAEPHRRKAAETDQQRPAQPTERDAFSHGGVWPENGPGPGSPTHLIHNVLAGTTPLKTTPLKTGPRMTNLPTTSLTPFGMSFWALIHVACGGGGGGGGGPATSGTGETPAPADGKPEEGFSQIGGSVWDPPVQNAPVYVDANGDGELNPDDGDGVWEQGEDYLIGRTDAQGRYSGSVPVSLKNNIPIAHTSAAGVVHKNPDGTDASDLPEVLKANANAPVISVLSHSVVQGYATEESLKNQSPDGYDPFKHNFWIEGGVPAGVTTADVERIKQFVKTFTSTIRRLEAKVGSLEERYAEITKQLDRLIKRVFGTSEEAPEQSEPDLEEAPVDPTESTPASPPPAPPMLERNAKNPSLL